MVAFLEAFRPRRVKRLTAYDLWNVWPRMRMDPFIGKDVQCFYGPGTCIHYGGMSRLRREGFKRSRAD